MTRLLAGIRTCRSDAEPCSTLSHGGVLVNRFRTAGPRRNSHAHSRLSYPPTERMAILALKATPRLVARTSEPRVPCDRGNDRLLKKRVDAQGPNALVQLREPVSKFPDCVRFVVQQLKALCPTMGKRKIPGTLARHRVVSGDHHSRQPAQRKARGTTGSGGGNRLDRPSGYLQIRKPRLVQ